MMVIACLATLALAEAALRIAVPGVDRHYVLVPGYQRSQTPRPEYIAGVSGVSRYEISAAGVRGSEMSDADDYRILAIGGSTTQNTYLDDTETWTLAFADMLNTSPGGFRVWSGDIGRSGHTARSHLLQLRHVVRELEDIDAVVMLVGVNDLTVALRAGEHYERPAPLSDPVALAAQMQEAFLRVPGGLHEQARVRAGANAPPYKGLALYQLLSLSREALARSRSGTEVDVIGATVERWRNNRRATTAFIETLPDLDEPLDEYLDLLNAIVSEAALLNVRLIFMTQPTLWSSQNTAAEEDLLWLGGIGDFQGSPGSPYYTSRALFEAMNAWNDVTLDVCAASEAECIDIAAAVPRDTTMFYDDVHFTEAGSLRIAEELSGWFQDRPPFAPPAAER